MVEYRARMHCTGAASSSCHLPGAASSSHHPPIARQQTFSIDKLAERYGLEDLMDFTDHTEQPEQSIDDEYNAYTTSALSQKGTDILSFWEVCIDLYILLNIRLIFVFFSAQ